MDIVILCALGAVGAGALDAVCYESMMKRGACSVSVLFLSSIIASLTMLLVCDWNLIFEVDWDVLIVMGVSCAIWGIADWSNVEAYRYMDASLSEMFSALTLIVVLIGSVLFFQETINSFNWIGVGLIFASLFYRTKVASFKWNKGVIVRLVGVLFGASALIYDKYLTDSLSGEIIVFYGFLFMAVFYFIAGNHKLSNIQDTMKKAGPVIFLSPFLSLISYYCLITAFTYGELAVTYTIEQSCVVIVFFLEVVILRARENLVRRGVACFCCMIGALLVCVA